MAVARKDNEVVNIKRDGETYSFETKDIDDYVEARLEEIFEKVQKELKKAGKDKKLPSGLVLTGGGANLRKINEFAKNHLELASQVADLGKINSAAGKITKPELSAAIGLERN